MYPLENNWLKNRLLPLSFVLLLTIAAAFIAQTHPSVRLKISKASGAVYYVSPSGDDNNPGVETSPWRTIQKGVNALSPGDGLIVLEGNYPERVTINNSGTSNARITIEAKGTVTTRGFVVNAGYINLTGFTLTAVSCDWGEQASGIYIRGDYAIVSGNYAYNNPLYGIATAPESEGAIIQNNRINRSVMAGLEIHGTGHLVMKNEVWATVQRHSSGCTGDADGIRFFGNGHIFRKNYIHDIHFDGNLVTDAHIDCFQTWSDQYHLSAANIIIEQNYCEALTHNSQDDHGTGAMLSNSSNVLIKNNIFTSFRGINEASSGSNTGLKIINNTLVSDISFPVDGLYPMAISANLNGAIVKNNIFYNFNSYTINGNVSGADVSDNIAYKSNGQSPQLGGCTNCIIADPEFVNPSANDYHLQAGSPAIDAGANVLSHVINDYDGYVRPYQSAFDIGAYEYGSGPGVSPNPTPTATPAPTPTPYKPFSPFPTLRPPSSPTPSTAPLIPGDANGDGKVDGQDYLIWVDNYGIINEGEFSLGDFNGDKRVDGQDYFIWLDNYNT